MFFIDEKHEKNFADMLSRFPQGERDYQYRIGCYITAHPNLYAKISQDIGNESPVEWAYRIREAELEVDLTSAERHLVEVMLNLWNGTEGFDLNRAISVWDQYNFEVFLQAIKIAR